MYHWFLHWFLFFYKYRNFIHFFMVLDDLTVHNHWDFSDGTDFWLSKNSPLSAEQRAVKI